MTATAIWYRDPAAAFGRAALHQFVPLRTMNATQQLNSVFRLSIYYAVIMTLLCRSPRYLCVALIVGLLTAAIHEFGARAIDTYVSATGGCVAPTPGNPYMNVTLADLQRRTTRPAACDPRSPAIMAAVDDVDEPFPTDGPYDATVNRWYTMPVTTVPNDQDKFARALYGGRQSNALGSRA